MDNLTLEQLKEKTREILKKLPEGAYEFELRLQVLALQLLAKGEPVTPEKLSEVWGIPLEQVKLIFDQATAQGTLQLDDSGNMVGAAISLVPTKHTFRMNGNKLYAWCAYDAIFAPGVIGEKAVIESIDPWSKEPIQIMISPEGEIVSDPEGVVATYVGMEADIRGGAESPRCNQMHFFTSEENAKRWIPNHQGISIMTVNQMLELAKEFQIEPAKQMGLLS